MKYAIDLFSGAGGMSEGLIQAGFHILFSSDINEQVELTYTNRHHQLGLVQGVNTHYERRDIRDLSSNFIMQSISALTDDSIPSTPEIDAIFGGPPCQGFSLAGKRKQNDPRNFLFKEYLRVVNEIRPKYVVMENVEGFMTAKLSNFVGLNNNMYKGDQKITSILLNEFKNAGYKTLEPRVLDSSDYGVPQKRNRAIFIAYLPHVAEPKYPSPTQSKEAKVTVNHAISDLISDSKKRKRYYSNNSKYQTESLIGRTPNIVTGEPITSTSLKNYEFSKHEKYIVERFSLYKIGEDTQSLRNRIKSRGISIKSKGELLRKLCEKYSKTLTEKDLLDIFSSGKANDEMINVILTKKNNRKKMSINEPSPTIVTLPDDYISPFENRILTVREMARLQSFDDSFEFLGKRTTGGLRRREEVPQYSQVGNAVPPLLSKAIASSIMSALNTR